MMTILAFVVAIALLVTFHEFGHYLVARRCNVKVLRFSLGFGKIIYRKRFTGSDTEWVVSAIPLGGYVKMLDEREGEVVPAELHLAFNRKPVLQRMAIVVAGPLANFLLAIVLYWVMFVHGIPGLKPMLGDITPNSPAAIAQLHAGDMVLSVNGVATPSWQQLHWQLLDAALQQEPVALTVRTVSDEQRTLMLNMGGLEGKDLEGDFLAPLGLQPYQPVVLPVLGKIAENSVAQQVGLQTGDQILRVDGVEMKDWRDVVAVIRNHPEQAVQLEVQRGVAVLHFSVVPQAVQEQSGKPVGKIGVGPKIDESAWRAMFTDVSYGPVEAVVEALHKTWQTSIVSLKMMGKMVTGEISARNISGPLTIADYAGQSASMGAMAYLGFLALISISLGVMNLLPIPLLDGGHLLYYAAELVKGSPVSEQGMEIGQRIGIAILGVLMTFAIYNDIHRLLAG